MPSEKPQARYKAIAAHLQRGILDGTYPAGQPLPSEEILAKQFGVSRPTVRQGIAELRAAGLVEVMMGRGMFVRSPHARPSLTVPRGVRQADDGRYVEADGIRWDTPDEPGPVRVDATLAVAELLRIPVGDPVLFREALRMADRGRLRQLYRAYVPLSVLADGDLGERASLFPHLYETLSGLGYELHFTEYVRTRMPLPEQVAALRLPEGVPVLVVVRLTLDGAGRPLALEEFHWPGDDLELKYGLA